MLHKQIQITDRTHIHNINLLEIKHTLSNYWMYTL